jgi:glycosyltransferase involved in cell wall biosynthesis
MKLPVSVCIISGAEAHRIGRALDSVSGWTEEIVVVLNQEAADGTDRIAGERGARVVREPWQGFVAQKNSVLSKASQPWVLGLDADEAVSPELRDEIATLLSKNDNQCEAYSFPRLSFYLGRWIRHGDWYPDRCTRLWQRGKAHWTGIDPHASLKVEGSTGRLKNHLWHYTTDTLDHQLVKTSKYADDFVVHCRQQGRQIRMADLLVRPAWRFVRAYFVRLGFLDGWQGYTIAYMTAFYTFLRYAKAREAQIRVNKPE